MTVGLEGLVESQTTFNCVLCVSLATEEGGTKEDII